MFAATSLSRALLALGFRCAVSKTGTPARVLRSSIRFDHLEAQPGEEPVVPFSFETTQPLENRLDCHITWTTPQTKQVILEKSPPFAAVWWKNRGVGPRYCPSIEDKIVRFADKERHQVFIEPCGWERTK